MPLCRLPHVDLFYVERGQGEPLLFLNGLAGDSQSWMGQLKAFGKQFHCLALDSRDIGQSSPATEPYSIRTLAEDVAGFMKQLGLDSAHVVGLSMGGMVAQELALLAPERIRSLVLVNTLARADEWFQGTLKGFELIRRQVADTAAFFDAILPWWVSAQLFDQSGRSTWLRWLLAQNAQNQSLDGFLRQLTAVRSHDTLDRLSGIRCPVLILSGEDDRIAPPRYSVQLQQRLPQASSITIPAAGHAVPIEDPGQFNKILGKFLADQRSPQRHSA